MKYVDTPNTKLCSVLARTQDTDFFQFVEKSAARGEFKNLKIPMLLGRIKVT